MDKQPTIKDKEGIQDANLSESTLIDLLPCPFCGAEGEEISLKPKRYHGGVMEIKNAKFWFVECLPCGARTEHCFDKDSEIYGFKNGVEEATDKWNRRAR